jgi:hypothetical protein
VEKKKLQTTSQKKDGHVEQKIKRSCGFVAFKLISNWNLNAKEQDLLIVQFFTEIPTITLADISYAYLSCPHFTNFFIWKNWEKNNLEFSTDRLI